MKSKLNFFILFAAAVMILIQTAWCGESIRVYDNKDGKYVNVSPAIYDSIKREGSVRYGPEPGKLFVQGGGVENIPSPGDPASATVTPPDQVPDKPSDSLSGLFDPANTVNDPNPPKGSGNQTSDPSIKVEEHSVPAKINGENKELKYTVPVLPSPPPVPPTPGNAVEPQKTMLDRLFNRNKR